MSFYNFFLNRFVLPFGDFVLKSSYLKHYNQWQHYDTLSAKALNKLEANGLKQILNYTCNEVPFYNTINYKSTISPYENLKAFPVLTKALLREKQEQLVSKSFKISDLVKNYSSGSSGQQSYIYSDAKNSYKLQAIQTHWYAWSGYQRGDALLQFGMSTKRVFPKNIKDFFFKTSYYSAFTLNPSDFERLYNTLKRKNINYILGYPSAIYEFAKFLNNNSLTHQLKGIISLGDKLFPHYEKTFERCFKSLKLIDTYGCAEGLMMACRNDLPYYYIMSPHVYIELLDQYNNPVADGEMGHVVVTCFTNLAQPIIRYKIGDLAVKLPKENYPKQRLFEYPLLEKIIGRETDVVKTKTGETLIVHSFTGIFEFYPEIKQFKITQKSIDAIDIEYVTDKRTFSETLLKTIAQKINAISNNNLTLNFIEVDYITPSPSGKPQIIVSHL